MRLCTAISAAFAVAAASLAAIELPIDGGFSATNAAAFPSSWTFHAYSGYVPHGTAQVVDDNGTNVLHYYGAGGESGDVLKTKRKWAGLAGDIVTVSLWARGSGKMWFTVQCWSNSTWATGISPKSVELAGEWRKCSASFVLSDVKSSGLYTTCFETALGIKPGADAWIRDVRLSRLVDAEELLAYDDFEADRERPGEPEIVTGYVAPGLLAPTRMGCYSTASSVTLAYNGQLALPAADERHFMQSSFRLYDFGKAERVPGTIRTEFAAGGETFAVDVSSGLSGDLLCSFGGKQLPVPYEMLPADFAFSFSADGLAELSVVSLASSTTVSASATNSFFRGLGSVSRAVSLVDTSGGGASAMVDNLSLSRACVGHLTSSEYPYTANVEETFDPVAAGWPLVFSDEFDGDEVDTAKWRHSSAASPDRCSVSNGVLRISTDYDESGQKLSSGSLWSRQTFLYGYFEARLRFTTYNGWWAAFWLCSGTAGNPFIDGFEIDIFEDYYMRNPARNKLDHNLHARGTGVLKSWNYNSILPGTCRDWYTIGCKWTPWETTYYMNGQVIRSVAPVSHSPYQTVTFDAFRHCTTIMPLHAILSGQIMSTAYGWHEPEADEIFPEAYEVDYLRIYSCPDTAADVTPSVTLSVASAGRYMVPAGSLVRFRAETAPSPATLSPIKAVHLFDSGYWIATVTNEPYEFSFPMTQSFFDKTSWMRPGRQSDRPTFSGSQHVFCAFAEDAAGRVGHSATFCRFVSPTVASTPYGGTPQAVPGTIVVGRYDEGGQGVAYHDTTPTHNNNTTWRQAEAVDGSESTISSVDSGEWVNYTVDIAESGRYRLLFKYGTPQNASHHVHVLVDGDRVAESQLHAHEAAHYGTDTTAVMEAKMPAGRHVLTLVFFGVFNVANMVVEKISDGSGGYVWTGGAGDGDWTNPVNWGRSYGWDYPYFGEPAILTNVSFAVCGGMGTVRLAPAGVATGTVFRLSAGDWLLTNVVAVLPGGVQASGDTLRLAAGSRLEVETTTVPIGKLRVEKGASVVFPGGKACLRADQVSVAGVVTAEGPLADMEHTNRVWIACRDFTLEASGAVDLKGRGWAGGRHVSGQGQTPGVGPGASSTSAGAGHGGLGAMTRVGGSVGRIYDDPLAPSLPGSGAYTANGSGGGGAVRIDATGAVRIDGAIDASAASGSGCACGSSGGSVWISAASVAGSGSVRADGGGGSSMGGGGGMIRIDYDPVAEASADLDGFTVSAAAGLAAGRTVADHDDDRKEADLGTLAFADGTIVRRLLGRRLDGRIVSPAEYRHEGDLVWTNGHVRFAGDGAAVTVTGDLIMSNSSSRAEIGGMFSRTNVGVFVDCWGGTNATALTVGGGIFLRDGAALDIRAAETNASSAWGGLVRTGGDLVVGAGSRLRPWCEICGRGSPRFLVGGDFTVEAGGRVIADRRGCMGGRGGSAWKAYFRRASSAERGYGVGSGSNTGSSHGGVGGRGVSQPSGTKRGTPGVLVDDEWSAEFPGAGGGSAGYGEGGEGGGLVHVAAVGVITVDGEISANGWRGTYVALGSDKSESDYCTYFGSGAGGGIRLCGSSFAGSGRLSARGGDSVSGYVGASATYGYASGAGGGGRIFVATDAGDGAQTFSGVFDVGGGTNVPGHAATAPFDAAVSHGGEGTVRFARLSETTDLGDDWERMEGFRDWLAEHGLLPANGTLGQAAARRSDRSGAKAMTLLEEYVAGTVPGDDKSVFVALIEMVDGSPRVTWSPALNGEGVRHGVRTYRLFGSDSLGHGAEWREIEDAASSGCHFFKVTVELP